MKWTVLIRYDGDGPGVAKAAMLAKELYASTGQE
jgi:hypothetical protein